MPCANCTMMGFAINLVLTPNHSTTYKIMNEFIVPKSKRQHISSSFILQFNLSKLKVLLLCTFISAMMSPWKINLLWAMHSLTQGGLGQCFVKCPLLSQLKHLTLDKFRFTFFIGGFLLVEFSLSF